MQAADLEMMIADFERKQLELAYQIKAEEERTGVSDPNHFNYPTAARAAMIRRENLNKSIEDLREQLKEAKESLDQELAELRKLELLIEKDGDMRRQHGGREEARRVELRR
ncbi:flagellar export protein FliJ [Rhodoligotrophos defluvii]|uniref:flagellar export protein FliJ n=1 Tax=Rhodoligotrophos defluvii TaxID=2561934 RepID=UPI001961D044|nr:flagellar export protein FliJ [Rhodoligotrophos defluvii]